MSRLGNIGNNQLLEMLRNPEIALAEPLKINSNIINRYLKSGFNPNMEYQDGTRVITQAIYNLSLAKAQSNNNVQANCLQIIKTLIDGGAILDENDEAKLNSLEPNWKAIIGYSSNNTNTMLASDIMTHEIPYGQYVEAGTEKDLQQYMGKGGRSRKHRRKLRHSRSKRGGRKLRRSGRSRKLSRGLNGRKLKGG
jgi:hypothetical protein